MHKILPLLFLFALAGCKKDDTADFLTRSWQVKAITFKSAQGDRIERDISSCDYNRIYTFREDGSFLSEPAPGCILNGISETYAGTWTLVDKMLKIQAQGGRGFVSLDADIVLLTKSRLVLRTGITLDGREGIRYTGGSQIITEFNGR